MLNDVREPVMEWLTGIDTCFLLGAGCSKCAGKPLIGELTENIVNEADDALVTQFRNLKPKGSRLATIEDLITYLVRCRHILETTSNADIFPFRIEQIEEWMSGITRNIVGSIADNWKPSGYHKRFLKRFHNQAKPRDIFSLNYDTILEASLDDLRLPYLDGFLGTNRAWFDVDSFNVEGEAAYRVFKIHGSVNWIRDGDGYVRRVSDPVDDSNINDLVVVYPSEQKYIQTQQGVYESLMMRFRERLRFSSVNNCLVVLGYSFNDEHINEAICNSVNDRDSNLTVISFIGPDSSLNEQRDHLRTIETRCDSRFNAFVGSDQNGFFIGTAVDCEVSRAILRAELWKFENLVDLATGD